MPSFDVVSRLDFQEIDNAIGNATREILNRYDFKGSNTSIERKDNDLTVVTDDELKLNIILKDGEKYDHAEFCTWMAEKAIIAMVPRFIEIFEEGFPVTATQKVKVAELKEITDKTWDRAESGLKFSARK